MVPLGKLPLAVVILIGYPFYKMADLKQEISIIGPLVLAVGQLNNLI